MYTKWWVENNEVGGDRSKSNLELFEFRILYSLLFLFLRPTKYLKTLRVLPTNPTPTPTSPESNSEMIPNTRRVSLFSLAIELLCDNLLF